MNITVREINGIRSKERYADVNVEHFGNKLEIGVLDISERREMAEHLQSVVDDLLYELPNSPTTEQVQN